MNIRENTLAVLHYEPYERLPILHFGYWAETLEKWAEEGHITWEEAKNWADGNAADLSIAKKLGFDANWSTCFGGNSALRPGFEPKVLEELPNGLQKVVNHEGVIELVKPHVASIPSEVDHLLKDRASYEEHYKPRLQYSDERIDFNYLETLKNREHSENMLGIHIGSLFGNIRNWCGVEGISYLYADDEELYKEIIDDNANLCYQVAENILKTGVHFDFAHFWEDICFKNGPLVIPSVFEELVGPHYKRITGLLKNYGVDIVSLDCDGMIDSLIPIWFENGVNTMFPIEVGTWNASIAPWREKYGKGLRGVGGMNKTVFAKDFVAIDEEIERLRPLVALGGYIPCPDHRIAPDAKWENVQYYCKRMHEVFTK